MAHDSRLDIRPRDRSRKYHGYTTAYPSVDRRRDEVMLNEDEDEYVYRSADRPRHRHRRERERDLSPGNLSQSTSPSRRYESGRVSRYERCVDESPHRRRWRSPVVVSDSCSSRSIPSRHGRPYECESPAPRGRYTRRSVRTYSPSPLPMPSAPSYSPSPIGRRSDPRVDSHHTSCEQLYRDSGYLLAPRPEPLHDYDPPLSIQPISYTSEDLDRPHGQVRRRASVSGYSRPHVRQPGSFLEVFFGRPAYPTPSMRRPASVVAPPAVATPPGQNRPSMRRSNTTAGRPVMTRPSLARRKELPKPIGMEAVENVFDAPNSVISTLVEPTPPPPRVPESHRRRNTGIFSSLGYSSPAVVPRAAEERKVECLSCMDDVLPRKAAHLECGHHMCKSCLKRVFRLSITDPSLMPPKCCSDRLIPLKHVAPLFDDTFKRKWNRKYQEYTTKNRMYCPKRGCGEWIKPNHIKSDALTGRQFGNCKRCGTKVCRLCNQKWHGRKDCPNDEETKRVVDLAKEEGWQRCYNCKTMVELREGCNHMTCRCTAEFCMICGLKWKTCECPWFNLPPDTGPGDGLAPPEPVHYPFGPDDGGYRPRRARRHRNEDAMAIPPTPEAPPPGLHVYDILAVPVPAPPPPVPFSDDERDDDDDHRHHYRHHRRAQEREDARLARRLALADLDNEPMLPEAPLPPPVAPRRRTTMRSARVPERGAAPRGRTEHRRALPAIEAPRGDAEDDEDGDGSAVEEYEAWPRRGRGRRRGDDYEDSEARRGVSGVSGANMAGLEGGRTGAARVRLWRQHV